MTPLKIIAYNVRSLYSELRTQLLMQDLEDVLWDLVVITETWRDDVEEVEFESRHVFYGSGGSKGSCGTGFLMNSKLKVNNFCAISPRLCTMDILLAHNFSLRVCAVYMPDGFRPEWEVDMMYLQLDEVVRAARTDGVNIVIGGTSMRKLDQDSCTISKGYLEMMGSENGRGVAK